MTSLARIAGGGEANFVPSRLRPSGEAPGTTEKRDFAYERDSATFDLDLPPADTFAADPACFVAVLRTRSGEFLDPKLIVQRADGSDAVIAMEHYRYGVVLVLVAIAAGVGPMRRASLRVDCRQAGFSVVGAGWMPAKIAGRVLTAASRQRFAPMLSRLGRALYRMFPAEQATKLRWARRIFPYTWLQTVDPAADLFRPKPGGADAEDPGVSAVSEVYRQSWNQSVGNVDRLLFGELAERPVNAARCDTRLIAYYLPQYHPFPENDRWWGRGFTEWTNVGKAVPVFAGHYQPRLPGELGYYDLRVVDVMRRQVELAKLYGIAAFCFYFYWFGGKRLLELPVLNYLANPDLDLPFCLCWANENWTRRWDGAEREILIAQAHSPEDDVAFIRHLKRYFDDPRYLKIDGRPVLTVYRPTSLPEPAATVARWRVEAKAMGFPDLYLVATNAFGITDYADIGFDAISEFPPHGVVVPNAREEMDFLTDEFTGLVHRYADVVRMPGELVSEGKVWPGVMPGWDNVARMPRVGRVFHGATPALFREWLMNAIVRARRNPPAERFVMVNAWNEWAEGAYLEPDRRFGYGWLAACASAIADSGTPDAEAAAILAASRAGFQPKHRLAVLLHLSDAAGAGEVVRLIRAFGDLDVYVTVPRDISVEAARSATSLFPGAYLQEVPNRGRDILPFLAMLEVARERNYEFVLKLHAPHGGSPAAAALLSDAARTVLRAASAKPKVGVLAQTVRADPGDERLWRHARERAKALAAMLGVVDLAADAMLIPSGMFWFRPGALERFREIAGVADFEPELGQAGGTLAHALSCLPAIAARAAGFDMIELEQGKAEARR